MSSTTSTPIPSSDVPRLPPTEPGVRGWVRGHPGVPPHADPRRSSTSSLKRTASASSRSRRARTVSGPSFAPARPTTAASPPRPPSDPGPAAGDALLITCADATGAKVAGTLNNCAGGVTPWGTYLTGEENFDQYFATSRAARGSRRAALEPYGLSEGAARGNIYARFDIAEGSARAVPLRLGVGIDPRTRPRRRRSAPHSAASSTRRDPRARRWPGRRLHGRRRALRLRLQFVTAGLQPGRPRREPRPARRGTLYVARLNDDGSRGWLPLTFGEGPLTAENGFATQADVLIETRLAADLLGATPMDRPEDIVAEPAPASTCDDQQHRGPATPTLPTRGPKTPTATSSSSRKTAATTPRQPSPGTSSSFPAATPGRRVDLLCRIPQGDDQQGALANPDNITFDAAGQPLDHDRRSAELAGDQATGSTRCRRKVRNAATCASSSAACPPAPRCPARSSHAGQHHPLRRYPAPRRRRRRLGRLRPAVLLRGPLHPLARLRRGHAGRGRRSWRSPARAAAASPADLRTIKPSAGLAARTFRAAERA